MAPIYTMPKQFHEGEQKMRSLLHVPDGENPTSPGLSPHATRLLHRSSLLAVGTLDEKGQPWTTLLGGEPGFARSLGRSIIGVRSLVGRKYDPVIDVLVGGRQDEKVHDEEKGGKLVAALGFHLATRDRVKLSGKMVTGALENPGLGAQENENGAAEVQLALAIQQSLGM